MNLIELDRALRQLRLGGMAAVLETRLRQAQTETMAPIDLISCLVADELTRRSDRLLERRRKQAEFRDPQKNLDNFDFNFNPKMNRSLVFDLATGTFIQRHEDALFWGHPARVRVTWHRLSAKPPFNRATGSCTARRIICWKNWPKPSSTTPAGNTWSFSKPYPC